VFFVAQSEALHFAALTIAMCAGVAGVGGLVTGSGLLVWETRIGAAASCAEETTFMLKRSGPLAENLSLRNRGNDDHLR